jgi:hypothetical protein
LSPLSIIGYSSNDGDSPAGFVLSQNIHRRNLNSSQRACIAVEFEKVFAVEAKKRQVEAGKEHGRGTEKLVEKIPQANDKSRDQAAEAFHTNGRYVSDMKKILNTAPEYEQRIKSGEITIPKAKIEETERRQSVFTE